MKYQDLGGPTPFNYRPDDDSAKLSTTLTPKVRKKLDKICRLFRENRQWKSERQMEKIMLESYLFHFAEELKSNKVKKKSKKKSTTLLEPETFDTEDLSQDDGEKLIQIGGIYGYNEDAKSFTQFRCESYDAIFTMTERKLRRRKSISLSKDDPRRKKIEKLRSNDSHWKGLS